MTNKTKTSAQSWPLYRGRFFEVDGEWYFATRESAGHGPFEDYESAKAACSEFVASTRSNGRAREVS